MPTFDELRTAVRSRVVPEVNAALAASEAADRPVRAHPGNWAADGTDIDYFYRTGTVLARDADASRVLQALRSIEPIIGADAANRTAEAPDPEIDSPHKGVTRFRLPAAAEGNIPDLLDRLDERLGVGVVTHEHVFGIAPWVHCPATEPEQVLASNSPEEEIREALWPPPGDPAAGRGVRVSVVDTGLLNGVADWAPWLAGVSADSAADIDPATTLPGTDYVAEPYSGHGSFIAGVLRCIAPSVTVVVERMIGPSGFVSETDMIRQIHQGLSRSPDVICLSAGGYTRNDVPPVALQALFNERLSLQGGVVLVAAAGNNGIERPFWPAAFDWCVGVGSMARDGQRRSWFSNAGSWVDVYAPGEDLVNAYSKLKYRPFGADRGRDTSAGIVKWSGTSFATPVVAGLIAARMSRTGENGRTAAAQILAAARGQFRPDVGPRLFP